MNRTHGTPVFHYEKEDAMKSRKFLPLFLLTVLAAGCYPITVTHDYEVDMDFSKLKTFDWMPDPATAINNLPDVITSSSLIDNRVKGAVNSQLAAKGFQLVDRKPDFRVVYYLSVKAKLRDWGMHYDGRPREIEQGTLVLDFMDPGNMEIIWRGVAKRTLDTNPSPEKIDKNINAAVEKLLANFPPKGK
jgi:hypothetical protein